MGDVFNAFFGGGGRSGPASRQQRGEDALLRLNIELIDVMFGAEREVEVERRLGSLLPCRLRAPCRGQRDLASGTALLLGVLGFASQMPTFLISPFAGVLADRLNRHRILVATQAVAMVQALVLAVLTLTGTIEAWEPQIGPFAEAGYRVIAFDRRGWGESIARPETGSQPGTLAGDLDALQVVGRGLRVEEMLRVGLEV